MSAVFNVLYMFGIVGRGLTRAGFAIFIAVLFIISLIGIILKDIKKEEVVQINIITPIKEIGPLFVWALILWLITNGIVLFSSGWQFYGW
jgi:hypothetical protein